jgi:glucan 1,3-beta-glucosidase
MSDPDRLWRIKSSTATNAPIGSCAPFTDWWTWDAARKTGFRDLFVQCAEAVALKMAEFDRLFVGILLVPMRLITPSSGHGRVAIRALPTWPLASFLVFDLYATSSPHLLWKLDPMWNYKLGLQQGYIPANARDAQGACARLAAQYSVCL